MYLTKENLALDIAAESLLSKSEIDEYFMLYCCKNIVYGQKCIIDQYKLLKKCSYECNTESWNKWRSLNPDEEIFLQGADLRNFFCENANFDMANLESAFFWNAKCKNTSFYNANCKGTYFRLADCENACFAKACCDKASFPWVNCNNTSFFLSSCIETKFSASLCQYADYTRSICESTDFSKSNMSGCDFSLARFNSKTNFYHCAIDNKTNFEGANFYSTIIEPEKLAKIEHNIRKEKWKEWYGRKYSKRFFLTLPIQLFWIISDYGYSTLRIFITFSMLVLLFSLIYYNVPYLLAINGEPIVEADFITVFTFSLSTMITLGFSNINVLVDNGNPDMLSLIVVTLNLLSGYFLLAVIVTRLSIVFSSLAPKYNPYKNN